jgi:CRP/FNR family transcriptional regulator, cyclic AMP receptor protein
MQGKGTAQARQNSFGGDSEALIKRYTLPLAEKVFPAFYPKGGVVFLEGQPAAGVFFLRTGRVKESVLSYAGKAAIVRVVGPGVILGLSAVLAGTSYESSAETLEPAQAEFLWRGSFLHQLKTSAKLDQIVVNQLSRNCKEVYDSVRCLGLSGTASERLARVLLQWAECPLENKDRDPLKVQIQVVLTQEEIGQTIGMTRETTSRTLREFRNNEWITTKGHVWTIHDEDALRRAAGFEPRAIWSPLPSASARPCQPRHQQPHHAVAEERKRDCGGAARAQVFQQQLDR